jgi:hypothetical protein
LSSGLRLHKRSGILFMTDYLPLGSGEIESAHRYVTRTAGRSPGPGCIGVLPMIYVEPDNAHCMLAFALTGPMGRGKITGPSKNSSKPLSFEAAISFNCTPANPLIIR